MGAGAGVAAGAGGACSAETSNVPVNRVEHSKAIFGVFIFIIITAASMAENRWDEKLNLGARGTRGIPGAIHLNGNL